MNETTARDPWATACEKGNSILEQAERDILNRQVYGLDRYQALCELEAYILRHQLPTKTASRYDMPAIQLHALAIMADVEGAARAILEAFLYGQAKGYRAGLAASKRRAGA